MKAKYITGLILFFLHVSLLQAQIYNLKSSNDGSIAMWTYLGCLCVMKCTPPYDEILFTLPSGFKNYPGVVLMSSDGKCVFSQCNDTIYKFYIAEEIIPADTFILATDSVKHHTILAGTDSFGEEILLYRWSYDNLKKEWGETEYFIYDTKKNIQSTFIEHKKKIDNAFMDDMGNVLYFEKYFEEGGRPYYKYFRSTLQNDLTWKYERLPVPIYMYPIWSGNSVKLLVKYSRKNSQNSLKSIFYMMDENDGNWSKRYAVLPNLPDVTDSLQLVDAIETEGVESAKISPDGTKIVYEVQETSGNHINYFMVSKFINGKWCDPEKILEMPAMQHVSYLHVSDSNVFFYTSQYKDEYDNYGEINRMYLYTSFDKNGTLIEKSPDPAQTETISSSNSDFAPDDYKIKPKFMSLWPFGKKDKINIFSFSIDKYIKRFNGLSVGLFSSFKRIDGIGIGLYNGAEIFNGFALGVFSNRYFQLNGISIGIVNKGDMNGVQIGLVNITDNGTGLQIGIFNYTYGDMMPVQIGAVNYIETGDDFIPCLILPGINPVGLFTNNN
jgi:hypothetical protein